LAAFAQSDADPESSARSFAQRVSLEGDAEHFVEKMESRIPTGRPSGSTRRFRSSRGRPGTSPRTFAWIAAGVALTVVLLSVVLSPTGSQGPELGARGPGAPPRPASAERKEKEAEHVEAARRLAEVEKRRKELEAAKPDARAGATEGEEARRQEELARLRRIEEEMREFVKQLDRREPRGEPPKPHPGPSRAAEPVPGPAPTKPGTEAAVASLEQVAGEVAVLSGGRSSPATEGQELRPGQGLEVLGAASRATLVFPDQTRVALGPETGVSEIKAEGGKRLFVGKGTVRAEVSKQPKDQSMIFASPHGEARVLGTTLRILVDPDPRKGMRLEVEQGLVRLKNLAGRTADVPAGHYAVAATGIMPAVRSLPLEQIVLVPQRGKPAGSHWALIKDAKASAGSAYEARLTGPENGHRRAGFLEYAFEAEAQKDYNIWIRAWGGGGRELLESDSFAIELVGERFEKPCACGCGSRDTFYYCGYSLRPGYWWIGGHADRMASGAVDPDVPPVRVRFSRAGRQILRVYPSEPPVRIDSVWLSTTQNTRPADGQLGPEGDRK